MNSKLIGGIMLIIGTSIGGGMLALPVATAELGFFYSSLFLFGCWLAMTLSALLILEVNLCLPTNSNLISMAKATLGPIGALVTWLSYFLLLYALLAAYTAGGGDFLQGVLQTLGIKIPVSVSALLFSSILGYVIYRGIRSVDYINRGLMITKLSAYLLIVIIILPFISKMHLSTGTLKYPPAGLMVMITSFGFATIVPSLRDYFNNDVAQLRKAIIIGSFIPLICYILWDLAIMGVLPSTGEYSLMTILKSTNSTSELVSSLITVSNNKIITVLVTIFTSICLATSFLGVGLCLSDFLADGLNVKKVGFAKIWVNLLVLIPPLLIVLFYPNIFIKALNYAGVDCVILLMFLPAVMAWFKRYHKKIPSNYQVIGGKPLLIILTTLSILLVIQGF